MKMKTKFKNSTQAFEYLFKYISKYGNEVDDTKCLYNIGFYMMNPMENEITTPYRNWNHNYAEYEWEWYLSESQNAEEISKHAKIWKSCMDENGNVNSNYGYQWSRGNQLDYVINELKANPNSRRAAISIYDAKESHLYKKDTPCTYSIWFSINGSKLNMSVMMRSNDLVFGFCNDQYCFSNLQRIIAYRLNIEIGTYYHFANNIHIYKRHYGLNKK